MSKNLAIKGHPTRGNEVIALLEMLGGDNGDTQCRGIEVDFYYYIDTYGRINYEDCFIEDEAEFFTLDDFYKKYPFKVGDKVHIYVQNDDIDERYDIGTAEITSMRWNPTIRKIAYKMKNMNREFYKEEIKCKVDDSNKPPKDEVNMKDKFRKDFCERCGSQRCYGQDDELEDCERFKTWSEEGNMEEKDKAKAPVLKGEDYSNKRFGYKIPDGYEFDVVADGKIFLIPIKSKYPETYKECCGILGITHDYPDIKMVSIDECNLYSSFIELIRCRSAYWKIAGEEMGLDKPWEPNWTTFEGMPAIFRFRYNIVCDSIKNYHCLLVFPTEEMRDVFYENFKDLIEKCKTFL